MELATRRFNLCCLVPSLADSLVAQGTPADRIEIACSKKVVADDIESIAAASTPFNSDFTMHS